jgi:DNA-directed RNA polymerase sigma subunit (sigma70/sigma32)
MECKASQTQPTEPGEKVVRIDNQNDPVAMYLREVATVQPLSKDEETSFFKELGRLDRRNPQREIAARRLIEGHLQQVVDIVEMFSSSGVPMLELLQEGNIGLMKAIDSYAGQPSGEFSAFAAASIENAIRERVSQSK